MGVSQGQGREQAHRDCRKAVDILKRLVGQASMGNPRAIGTLDKQVLRRAKGLTFMVTKTGGLGLSLTRGRCFTIRRLATEPGAPPLWSAPLFGTVSNLGLGLTIGLDEVDTLIVLATDEAVDRHKRLDSHLGLDVDVIMGRKKEVVQGDTRGDASRLANMPYSLAGGALLDISVKGGAVTVDRRRQRALYGRGVSAGQVLDGGVAPLAQFEPLYSLLGHLVAGE